MPTGSKPEPSSFTKAIAVRINKEKTDRGMTNMALSKESGISRPLLVNMLQGTKHWDIDQLDAVCDVLKLNIVEVVATADKETRYLNVSPLRQNQNLEEINPEILESAADHNNHDSGEPDIP